MQQRFSKKSCQYVYQNLQEFSGSACQSVHESLISERRISNFSMFSARLLAAQQSRAVDLPARSPADELACRLWYKQIMQAAGVGQQLDVLVTQQMWMSKFSSYYASFVSCA